MFSTCQVGLQGKFGVVVGLNVINTERRIVFGQTLSEQWKNPSCLGWMMLPMYIYLGIMNSHCKAPVLNNQYMESKSLFCGSSRYTITGGWCFLPNNWPAIKFSKKSVGKIRPESHGLFVEGAEEKNDRNLFHPQNCMAIEDQSTKFRFEKRRSICPIPSIYGIFTYMKTIKINHSCT